MDIIIVAVLIVAVIGVIAILALLQARTGGNATQSEAVSLQIGAATYLFETTEWEAIRQFLTRTERAAVRALDQARANLHQSEAQLQQADTQAAQARAATLLAQAQAAFDFWQPEVYRAYQRAALAWFRTPPGKQWLNIHNLPNRNRTS